MFDFDLVMFLIETFGFRGFSSSSESGGPDGSNVSTTSIGG